MIPMKILIIDRDKMSAQMMATKLMAEGHIITIEASKNEAIERVAEEKFDIILLDPTPMRDARALTLNIKRNTKNAPYSILMTMEQETNFSDVMKMGCNDFMIKPVDPKELFEKIANAVRLQDFFKNLSNINEDFPSAGGVISKSAFHQISLSAIERGGRYNELAFILAISVSNYDEIQKMDGDYHASYSVSKMARHMVRLSRQSDIVGQTGVNEYSILLQRTHGHEEAVNAAKRFAASFDEIDDFLPADGNPISIHLNLMHLPTGNIFFDHNLSKKLSIPNQ